MTDWMPKLTLANRITIARFMLIPVFILMTINYMGSVTENAPNELWRLAAVMTFLITCVSDALDGYFARSRNERTRLGTLLDPLADKTLLLSGLILLTGPWGRAFVPHLPPWYVLLVISRDVLLIAGALFIHFACGHTEVHPRAAGKMATFFQMGLILWVLSSAPARGFPWMLGAASACTLISAFQYLSDGIRQLEKAHANEKQS